MKKKLFGVLPIIQVPFQENGCIDVQVLKKEIDWIFSVGANGLGTGMVSEILRLTFDERISLTNDLVELTAGRGSTFAAIGAESTKQAIVFAKAAEKAGCDAVMAIPPVTTRLPEYAILNHFRTLAEEVNLPLIVQDASGYVGQAIPLAVYIKLLELYGNEKILFKPEASPIGPNLSALREATSGKAKIFEGSGGILLVDSFRRKIEGTMPAVDLLDGVVALWNALKQGNEQHIYNLYFPICAIVALQLQAGLDGFLAIEKYILRSRGLFKNEIRRMPYSWELDPETQNEIDRLMNIMKQALLTAKS